MDKGNVQNDTLEKNILNNPAIEEMTASYAGALEQDSVEAKTAVPYDTTYKTATDEKPLDKVNYSAKGDEKMPMQTVDEGLPVNADIVKQDIPAAKVNIVVDSDRMKAKMNLSAPGPGGKTLTQEDILKSLEEHGITQGLKEKYITRLAKYPVYNITFLVAEGVPPVNGVDGELICHFENQDEHGYDEKEDKDYKNLKNIHQVSKDELLCDIVLPTQSSDGYDVYGAIIKGKQGKSVSTPNGNNTYLSKDGLQLFSACDGHAKRVNSKVSVQNVMIVENIDYATGNIKFLGDVTVKGDVREGFSVKSGGSIIIYGSVEANVILEAEHDITIKKGVNGKDGQITANGNLMVGYLQESTVKIKQDIFVDSVINSVIECGGSVTAAGRGGRIIGGFCKVNHDLHAKQLGNESNIPTSIEVVGPFKLSSQKADLEAKIAQNDDNVKKIDSVIALLNGGKAEGSAVENRKKVLKMMGCKRLLEAETTSLMAEISVLTSTIEEKAVGRIYVEGTMYSNVHINIDGLVYHNSNALYSCTVFNNDDKIGILQ